MESKFFAQCIAPHMWAVLGGSNPTIHDTKEEAEASAKAQNERASWAVPARHVGMTNVGGEQFATYAGVSL